MDFKMYSGGGKCKPINKNRQCHDKPASGRRFRYQVTFFEWALLRRITPIELSKMETVALEYKKSVTHLVVFCREVMSKARVRSGREETGLNTEDRFENPPSYTRA
jgi:hypothetical protein